MGESLKRIPAFIDESEGWFDAMSLHLPGGGGPYMYFPNLPLAVDHVCKYDQYDYIIIVGLFLSEMHKHNYTP